MRNVEWLSLRTGCVTLASSLCEWSTSGVGMMPQTFTMNWLIEPWQVLHCSVSQSTRSNGTAGAFCGASRMALCCPPWCHL